MVRLTERLKIVSKLNIIFFLQCTWKKHHFTLFIYLFYLSWNETELRNDEAQQSKSMGRSVSLKQRSNFIKVSFLYLLKILIYYHNSFFNSSGSTPYRDYFNVYWDTRGRQRQELYNLRLLMMNLNNNQNLNNGHCPLRAPPARRFRCPQVLFLLDDKKIFTMHLYIVYSFLFLTICA